MKKKTKRQKLVEKLDNNISLIIRSRDGKCLLCGKEANIKELDCHHFIHGRGNFKYRWDFKNCVSLHKGCHRFKIHNSANTPHLEQLKKNVIGNILTQEEYEEIVWDKTIGTKHTIPELEELVEITSEFIKKNDLS